MFFDFGNGVEGNICREETEYTTDFGLVNWGHANPKLTQKAFQVFMQKNALAKDSFEFSYSQIVKSKIGGLVFVAEQMETRKFRFGLTIEEEKVAFLEIFTSVSQKFENMQGDFPLGLVPGAKASSFRSGDLMGDLLSYYGAISNISLDSIKSQTTVLSVEDALRKYNNLKKEKVRVINWKAEIGSKKHLILSDIRQIIELSEEQKLSRKVSQKQRFYME